jgi:hypothetical protein
VRSTAAPYTESRLTRSVANERVGFPVVEHRDILVRIQISDPYLTLGMQKIFFFSYFFLVTYEQTHYLQS